ncbi:hypothetical protein BDV95DRAFT_647190 [Massariosphaeria phaeospora]|uniref:Uncharacterized protein n=1 Tax=Massariosphaeria phaeospora TaxID=100035 RepID=A0A7C8M3U5_9PLEO|nr:hypothetical protein BDV95DRAFT_647190 [Massariosphaeria phaeospora]
MNRSAFICGVSAWNKIHHIQFHVLRGTPPLAKFSHQKTSCGLFFCANLKRLHGPTMSCASVLLFKIATALAACGDFSCVEIKPGQSDAMGKVALGHRRNHMACSVRDCFLKRKEVEIMCCPETRWCHFYEAGTRVRFGAGVCGKLEHAPCHGLSPVENSRDELPMSLAGSRPLT